MRFSETTKPDRKSGGSREPALSEVERGPAVRLSVATTVNSNTRANPTQGVVLPSFQLGG